MKETCDATFTDFAAQTRMTFKDRGVHFIFDLPSVMADIAHEGILLPWELIEGHIPSELVQGLAPTTTVSSE